MSFIKEFIAAVIAGGNSGGGGGASGTVASVNGVGPDENGDVTVTQVQSDWKQTNESAADFIKNKPTVPNVDELVTKKYLLKETVEQVEYTTKKRQYYDTGYGNDNGYLIAEKSSHTNYCGFLNSAFVYLVGEISMTEEQFMKIYNAPVEYLGERVSTYTDGDGGGNSIRLTDSSVTIEQSSGDVGSPLLVIYLTASTQYEAGVVLELNYIGGEMLVYSSYERNGADTGNTFFTSVTYYIDEVAYKEVGSVHVDPALLPDDHINSLIDTKLGVIENGTY